MKKEVVLLLLFAIILSGCALWKKEKLLADKLIYADFNLTLNEDTIPSYDYGSPEYYQAKKKNIKYSPSCKPRVIFQVKGNKLFCFMLKYDKGDWYKKYYSVELTDDDIRTINKYLISLNFLDSVKAYGPPYIDPSWCGPITYMFCYNNNKYSFINAHKNEWSKLTNMLVHELFLCAWRKNQQPADSSSFTETINTINDEIKKDSNIPKLNFRLKFLPSPWVNRKK